MADLRDATRVARDARPTRGRRAFTVVELMIVIVMIAIVCTFALPKVNFTQFRVDAGARTVRTALQMASRLAVMRQYDVVVSFDTTHDRLRILEDNNNNATVDAGEHVTYANLTDSVHFALPPTGLSGSANGSIDGTSLKVIDGMPTVIFHRDGAASTDLTIYITSKRAEPGDFRCVQMTQATSRTSWWRYDGSQWLQASL